MNKRFTRRVGNVAHGTATVAFAPARGAFLSLVKFNVWGMATVFKNMSSQYKTYLDNAWYNLGGTPSELQDTINKNYSRKPIALKLAPKEIKAIYEKANISLNGIGEITLASVSAFITAATPIITAVLPLLVLIFQTFANKKQLPMEDDINYFDNNDDVFSSTLPPVQQTENNINTTASSNNTKILLAAAAAYLLFRK